MRSRTKNRLSGASLIVATKKQQSRSTVFFPKAVPEGIITRLVGMFSTSQSRLFKVRSSPLFRSGHILCASAVGQPMPRGLQKQDESRRRRIESGKKSHCSWRANARLYKKRTQQRYLLPTRLAEARLKSNLVMHYSQNMAQG